MSRIYLSCSISAKWLVGRFTRIEYEDMKNSMIYFSLKVREFGMIAQLIEGMGYPIIEIEKNKYKEVLKMKGN